MNFFKVFSDKTRLQLLQTITQESILCNFKEEPVYKGNTTIALSKALGISQSTLSHHIKILEEANLITKSRHGKWIHFFPNNREIENLKKAVSKLTQVSDSFQTIAQVKTKNISDNQFSELCSLLENHKYKIKHSSHTDHKQSCYMHTPNHTIILLDKTQSEILINTSQSNLEQVLEVKNLIERYLKVI